MAPERNQPTPRAIEGPLAGKVVSQVVCGGFTQQPSQKLGSCIHGEVGSMASLGMETKLTKQRHGMSQH